MIPFHDGVEAWNWLTDQGALPRDTGGSELIEEIMAAGQRAEATSPAAIGRAWLDERDGQGRLFG